MLSIFRYPAEGMDYEFCNGALRYIELHSKLATCFLQGATATGVMADVSRPPTEAERTFVASIIQATGNI